MHRWRRESAQQGQEAKRLDNEGKPLDAITLLAKSVESRTELERDRDMMHREDAKEWRSTINAVLERFVKQQEIADVRTRQFDHMLTISRDQSESISAIQGALTDSKSKQEPTLEEIKRDVKGIQQKIDQLPDENKKLLQTIKEEFEKEWSAFEEKMVQAVIDQMTKQPHDVNVPITINNPPSTLPEQTKPADATQKLGDTLPAVEADPTRPVAGGMPNGLAVTPPESKP